MIEPIEPYREAVVKEARSWIGTPYHRTGRIKGVGADCATLLAEVLINCKVIQAEDIEFYSDDWFQHTTDEKYLFRMMRHALKTTEAVAYQTLQVRPGNIVLAKLAGSRVYNHGAIVTCWPLIVHAIYPEVEEVDVTKNIYWSYKEVAVFDPWGKRC